MDGVEGPLPSSARGREGGIRTRGPLVPNQVRYQAAPLPVRPILTHFTRCQLLHCLLVPYEWIIDALDQTWSAIDVTLSDRAEWAFDAPTPCPGWTVRDVVSHIIGVEILVQGADVPRAEAPAPHVRNAIGAINEVFVAQRRHLSGSDVMREFRDRTQDSLQRLRSLSEEEWAQVGWSPQGQRPHHRFQELRVFDSWVHLQDIRDALLEPADDHGLGEEITLNLCEAALPYLWAKKVDAPEASLLRVNLTGRLARSIDIRVCDGRGVAGEPSGDSPLLEITTPVALFWRRCAGRINTEAFLAASATDCRGDLAFALELVREMVIAP